MKLLFCHDGPMYKDEEGKYYGVDHNDKMFSRYHFLAKQIKASIRVEKLTNNELDGKLSEITLENFSVLEIPNLATIKVLLKDRKKIKTRLIKEIKQADIIIARLPSLIGNIAIEIAKEEKKPYILELVGCPWDAYWNHSIKGKLIAPYMWMKTRYYVKGASHVMYVTEEFLQKRYPNQNHSIGCSDVELESFDDTILERRADKIIKMKDNKKVILATTAAVSVRYKGQEYVIKAISKLNKNGYNFEYHLIGGGDNTYLKTVAKKYEVLDKVKFIGALPHKDIFNYLDKIDIYIQPSKQEGLPRALVEAMSRGIPSIGSNAGGIPELINKDFIFHKGSVKEICKVLRKINKKIMLTEATRSYVKAKDYDSKKLYEKRYNYYNTFLNKEL